MDPLPTLSLAAVFRSYHHTSPSPSRPCHWQQCSCHTTTPHLYPSPPCHWQRCSGLTTTPHLPPPTLVTGRVVPVIPPHLTFPNLSLATVFRSYHHTSPYPSPPCTWQRCSGLATTHHLPPPHLVTGRGAPANHTLPSPSPPCHWRGCSGLTTTPHLVTGSCVPVLPTLCKCTLLHAILTTLFPILLKNKIKLN